MSGVDQARNDRVKRRLADIAGAEARLATFPPEIRQRLHDWQAAQGEWFDETVLEIVAEFIASDDKRAKPFTPSTMETGPNAYEQLQMDHEHLAALSAPQPDPRDALIEELRAALENAEQAIAEYYRYWTGGETRGSYDGKPERAGLWKSLHMVRIALAKQREGGVMGHESHNAALHPIMKLITEHAQTESEQWVLLESLCLCVGTLNGCTHKETAVFVETMAERIVTGERS